MANNGSVGTIHNLPFIEEQLEKWQKDPASVEPSWRYFFEGLELGRYMAPKKATGGPASVTSTATAVESSGQWQVSKLIFAYRNIGHRLAHLNPLSAPKPSDPDLELSSFGFTQADLDKEFDFSSSGAPAQRLPLREIIAILRDTYCRTIGAEFMHIQDPTQRRWVQEKLESVRSRPQFSPQQKGRILKQLIRAEMFEAFVHQKYLGQKRFSLEGGEALIPALDYIRELSPVMGVNDIVIGMAHRGRLTILANVLDKKVEEIFGEFEDNYAGKHTYGSGDVKYHLGYSCDYESSLGGKVHLSLTNNPSHLEAVNPVALGRARAKQRRQNRNRQAVMPLLIHGDAAFAGQGLVMETLQLSQLEGYGTGGTFHIIMNNQLGFTTMPEDARSTPYSTDIAKMFDAPVFHVNANDPEAVIFCIDLCLQYRQQFGRDAFLDLICWRKYGHNEADDPSYTQPLMYAKIAQMRSSREVYQEQLVREGVAVESDSEKKSTQVSVQALRSEYTEILERGLKTLREKQPIREESTLEGAWKGFKRAYSHDPIETKVALKALDKIAEAMLTWKEGFNINKKMAKQFEQKRQAYFGNPSGQPEGQKRGTVDWAMAESLAFGSLLTEKFPVRLSGQDCRRGTFSHRHSVLFDTETGATYIPLNYIASGQEQFCVYNSPLSEAAVMGFDYGYSLDEPNMLILWEAQFGDFANGAQVIIDQFLVSSETKWQRSSGLVLLLPHGSEGQGPEHSSARLERFLQMCAEDNIQVCNLTTPAQYFHVLRRQMQRDFRKPLVIMTPKSLLRHPKCISPVEQLTAGQFSEVMEDPVVDMNAYGSEQRQVQRLLICSGKIYYDLLAKREATGRSDIHIIRLEQFYPWPQSKLWQVLSWYKGVPEVCWVQEEAENNGGWSFVAPRLTQALGEITEAPLRYIGREAAASPAVGSHREHQEQQKQIVENCFAATKSAKLKKVD